jgi:glycosyltransferase involved in cell wall biosynthesis
MDGAARTLLLLAKAPGPSIAGDPRPEYRELADALGAEILDFDDVAASAHPLVRAGAWVSPLCGLALLGFLRRRAFDRFYATGEDIAIPFGALLRVAGCRGRLTAVIHRCDTPNRSQALRGLGHEVFANVVCLATAQRRALICKLGFPSRKVHRLEQWVDTEFFAPGQVAPAEGPGAYVLACGRESRDYPTLTKAASALDLRVRVVASGWAAHAGFEHATGIEAQGNIEVAHGLSYRQLREAYARARFVVAPLEGVTYPAGVTSICEAMAMGKAIVVTAAPGILDYVKPGQSGLLVPAGDAGALREAMWSLWNDPQRCQAMGEHNRRWAIEHFAMERYVAKVAGLSSAQIP